MTFQVCQQCQNGFEVTDEDLKFLDKLSPIVAGNKYPIPEPGLCPDCRQIRRLSFYNRRKLYHRECSLTGKSVISVYSPDKSYTVYDKHVWHSDKWDPMDYAREYDFTRPFFDQFKELLDDVPMISLNVLLDNVNSDYTNDCYMLKDCYLVFDCEQGEQCYYAETFSHMKSSMDFLVMFQSELCYECTNCDNCYSLKFSRFCSNCHDSWFLKDCIGCKSCFGCVNLHQKQYHIFNKPHSKDEYKEFLSNFNSGNYETMQAMKQKFEDFSKTQPVKATRQIQCINCVGDNLNNSKDCWHCYDSNNLQDCRYCTNMFNGAKDYMDVHVWGKKLEMAYNSCVVGDASREIMCCFYVFLGASNIYYSMWCARNSRHLFGCASLMQKQYCILNKQYTRGEYEELVPRIIENMKERGEWGEFFPPEISTFGYNETIANEYYPMNKEEVLAKGWKWSDYEAPVEALKNIPADRLPNDIRDIPDEVFDWAIVCEKSGRPFKIIPQELKFYREHKLPLPRRHPDQRHLDRLALKNPRKLWGRECSECAKKVQTSYSPEREEQILCEDCYLKEVY